MKISKSDLKKRLDKVDQDKLKDVNLEKGDTLAMIIAALLTFLPPVIIICGILYFVVWVIFLR